MPVADPDIAAFLEAAGVDAATASAVMRIDALMRDWRRAWMKREFGHRALSALGIELDLAQSDVLFVVAGDPEGTEGEEVSVGIVAERLVIDPSRASRVVADLVGLGYLERAASQSDSRRTVLKLSESGWTVVRAVRAFKWVLMGRLLGAWPQEDVAAFVPRLEQFSEWTVTDAAEEAELSRRILDKIGPAPKRRP